MPRYRYDKDLDCMIEIREGNNYFEEKPRGPNVISDIEPYRAAASDVACGGKRPIISGRRQHREFLKRNGLTEVGNETGYRPPDGPSERQQEARLVDSIKRAMGEYGSNTGADRAAYFMRNGRHG